MAILLSKFKLEAQASLAPESDPIIRPCVRLRGGADEIVLGESELWCGVAVHRGEQGAECLRIATRGQREVFKHEEALMTCDAVNDRAGCAQGVGCR